MRQASTLFTPEPAYNPSIVVFSERWLNEAHQFARQFKGDKNFTHFEHTPPENMLTDSWRVYIGLTPEAQIVSWGQVQVFNTPRKLHVARLGIAVALSRRRQGLGKQMMEVMTDYCKSRQKLTASVYSDNTASVNLFKQFGFHVEGCFVAEEYFDDIPRDVLSLARFNNGS